MHISEISTPKDIISKIEDIAVDNNLSIEQATKIFELNLKVKEIESLDYVAEKVGRIHSYLEDYKYSS